MKTLEDRVATLETIIGSGAWAVTGGGVSGGGSASVVPPRRKVAETIIIIANDGDGEPFESLPDGGYGRRLVPASGRVLMPNGVTFYLDPTVFSHVERGKDGGALVTPVSTPEDGTAIRFMRAAEIDVSSPTGDPLRVYDARARTMRGM